MRFVFLMICLFLAMDTVVWICFDRRLRSLPHPRFWRNLLSCFMGVIIAFLAADLATMHLQAPWHEALPKPFIGAIFLWHFLVLPLTLLILLFTGSVRKIRQKPAIAVAGAKLSRRDFLAAGAMAAAPLATFALTGTAMGQIGVFRTRRFDLALPKFPRELDGFTIAVVADVHTGVFSTPKMLRDIKDCTNNLRADLILLAGDLVNISHADLPAALDMVCKLDAPNGVFMVEGNHDVIEGAPDFDKRCRQRGVRLLLDETQVLRPRGVPIQLLGTRWGSRDSQLAQSVDAVADAADPNLFSILLAHHPHSWDRADQRGIPLTISGHTHGGQIMLTDKIGGGPLRFKYWSGLYQKPATNLIVSNGVGNWFPLRVNAPAEIVHLTLRHAEQI